jgi:hypothetical protein
MASQYSNDRAMFRKNNPGVNTTQRSWDNYEGDRPVRGRQYSDFYRSSDRWGPGGSGLSSAMEQIANEEKEKEEQRARRKRRRDEMSTYDKIRMRNSPQLVSGDGLIA